MTGELFDKIQELKKKKKKKNKELTDINSTLNALIKVWKQHMIDNGCAYYDSRTGEFTLRED